MIFSSLLGPDGRFAWIAAALCRAVAAALGRGLMDGAMIIAVWRRVKRAEQGLLALAERVRLGRYRGGIVRGSAASEGGVEGAGAVLPHSISAGGVSSGPGTGWRRLPRRFGWLTGLMPYEAAGYASQLSHLLADPEMVAFLRDVPQAGRILGPLCRMLGIEASVIRPGVLVVDRAARAASAPRVRVVKPPVDWGRIPPPRGVLTWASRERQLERARARVLGLRNGELA